jgi:hypothetical protein
VIKMIKIDGMEFGEKEISGPYQFGDVECGDHLIGLASCSIWYGEIIRGRDFVFKVVLKVKKDKPIREIEEELREKFKDSKLRIILFGYPTIREREEE